MTQASYPLYDQHAALWPLVAPLESYEEEMQAWVALIAERLGSRDLEVLDLGTGGGHHLHHLVQEWPQAMIGTAVDLSGPMLERVAGLIPRFSTLRADMTSLRLGRRFPLVTVHDSFCYLTDLTAVKALLTTVAEHLDHDGLGLLKVDALAGEFEGPYRYLTTFEDSEREITLTHYEWDPDPTDSWIEVIYLFLERANGRVTTREERHRLGLFTREQLLSAASEAGLSAEMLEMERWDDERPNPLLVVRPTKGQTRRKGNLQRP